MNTAYARFAATALLCLFFIASSGSVYAAEGAQEFSPFARTGLLAHPGETAEEILLRAHELDAGAIALTVAGYSKGIGGFPEFRAAATSWSVLASRMGLSQSAAFLFLMRDSGDAPQDNESAEWLATCEYGKTSRFSPLFKEAGIFDIERECHRLLSFKRKDAAWEKEYQAELADWRSTAEESGAYISRARRLVSQQLTAEDETAFDRSDFDNLDFFFFYAATTHDPEREPPDWRADRLLRFLRERKKENSDASRELERGAMLALMRRLGADASPALDAIRRTHSDNAGAARVMGMNYLNGGMNFPLSSHLANVWLRYGAMAGDARCMELRAVQLYVVGDGRYAWIWAKLAFEYGDEDMQQRVGEILQAVEQNLSPDTIDARQKLLEETRALIDEQKTRKKFPQGRYSK